jgi:hypothetical protein
VNVKSLGRAADILAGDFSDPTNERLIYLSAAGLALVGLGLLVATILWWRRGRQEHPSLAPLEIMGTRAWAKAPEGDRRRRLEHVRLHGAEASDQQPVVAEPVDLEALVRSVPQAFDDLREPSAAIPLPAASEPVVEPELAPAVEAEEAAQVEPADDADSEVADDAAGAAEVDDEAEIAAEDEAEIAAEDEEIDATSISTMRPEEPSEALASGSSEPAS